MTISSTATYCGVLRCVRTVDCAEYNARMPWPAPFELSALVLSTLAMPSALALAPPVAGMTCRSLFGLRRIIGAEAPFTGWGKASFPG